MTATILGCGDTLIHAKKYGDLVVGSNDCEKHGMQCDYLVLTNDASKFKDEPERLKVIYNTKAEVLLSNPPGWPKFPHAKQLTRFYRYPERVHKGSIYYSATTPITSCCVAIDKGATELVLFGVDMLTHPVYRVDTRFGTREFHTYLHFFNELKTTLKIKTFIGALGTAFDGHLPLYQP